MSKLTNLKGRINYISSHARQENLYAVYETTDRKMWSDLAKCNQEEFIKSGTVGKCIEARELIIALPESFTEYEPSKLLEVFTSHFKQHYGVECIAALHHNKRKTNYHIHLIFAERKRLAEPIEKIAARNMFYDEGGKHVRTKKEILADDGELRAGCRIVPKGEVYERKVFAAKDRKFKSEEFLDAVKKSYTELINIYVRDDKGKLKVYDRNGAYLPMKKIGKNNPRAEQIESDNRQRNRWNQTVDRALVSGVPEGQIIEVRRVEIGVKASASIRRAGSSPDLFANLIVMAIRVLELIIMQIIHLSQKAVGKADEVPEKAEIISPVKRQSEPFTEPVEASKDNIPGRPEKTILAAKYPRLEDVYEKLQRQNNAIIREEQKLGNLEMELQECKGFFKGKRRKELLGIIEQIKSQLEPMKQGLTNIVTSYGYQNVRVFFVEYRKAKAEYAEYKQADDNWVRRYGNGEETQPKSIRARLRQYEDHIKRRGHDRSPKRKKDGWER